MCIAKSKELIKILMGVESIKKINPEIAPRYIEVYSTLGMIYVSLSFIIHLFLERDDCIMFSGERFREAILLVSHPDTYNEQNPLWYYIGTKSLSKRKYRVEK